MTDVAFDIDRSRSAFLFDVDGTLAATDALHALAYEWAVQRLTGKTPDLSAYVISCVKGGTDPRTFMSRLGVDVEWDRVMELKHERYRQLVSERLELRPGAAPFVERLQHLSLPIGIVSSSSRRSVEALVELLWPTAPPSVILSRDSTGIDAKPSPDPYLEAARALGCEPSASFALENSPGGAQAAEAANMQCVLILSEEFDRSSFSPEAIVTDEFTSIEVVERRAGLVLCVRTV